MFDSLTFISLIRPDNRIDDTRSKLGFSLTCPAKPRDTPKVSCEPNTSSLGFLDCSVDAVGCIEICFDDFCDAVNFEKCLRLYGFGIA